MTRATWNRIDRLSVASVETDDFEKADIIDACISRLLKRAGINLDVLEWDVIYTDYAGAVIEAYNNKGELIKAFSVL